MMETEGSLEVQTQDHGVGKCETEVPEHEFHV